MLADWFGGIWWQVAVDLATLLLAAAATYLAVREWWATRYERRRETFRLLRAIQALDSARLRRELSGAALHEKDRGLTIEDLIVSPGWCWTAGKPLVRLVEVELTPPANEAHTKSDYRALRHAVNATGILPRPRMRLADNLLLFTEDRSFDAPSYGLVDTPQIRLEERKVQLPVGVGSYFDFIDTCLCFGFEAANAAIHPRFGHPLRERFPLGDFTNRHAQIGIVTLIVVRNVRDGETTGSWFLLQRRSSAVTESANLVNAVPGGTFQPAFVDHADALKPQVLREALVESVVREFYEEFQNIEEFSELTSGSAIRERAAWQVFKDHTYFMGAGVNPLNPYVEILCLTSLDASRPADAAVFGGETYQHLVSSVRANYEGTIEIQPFNENTLRHYQHQYRSAPALKQLCRILIAGLQDESLAELIFDGPS